MNLSRGIDCFFNRCILISIFFFSCTEFIFANVKVNPLFSDGMVVQRETTIPIWGWANPNEKIEVKASWGKIATTVTDVNGNWRVDIETPKAGGPFTIVISGNNIIKINDVLSGEVWLCTGQSNMDFALEKFLGDSREPKYQPLVEQIRNEVATANDNQLRHIEVLQNPSLDKKESNFTGKWISAVPGEIKKITATGYFFAKELRQKLNVPIGLVECSWGATRVQPWISKEAYLNDENLKDYFLANQKEINKNIAKIDDTKYVDTLYLQKLSTWKAKGEKGKKPKPTITDPRLDRQTPTTLYNGMLHAIIPYAIKGAIWYQGESNAVYLPNQYQDFFTAMIKSWRADWSQGDFPFYFTQLASCKRGNDKADKGWAIVDDHLRRTLELPNTGMAVLHDVGEAKDVHPHNKMDVGKRLSLWALQNDYGIKVSAVSGPLYHSHKIKKDKIEVKFSEVGSGLMVANKILTNAAVAVNQPLSWFEIVGKDGVWHKAKAKIISDNKIVVWSNFVQNPINVRYAWSATPEGANLYNKEGLPAAIFSTTK